MRHSRLGVLIAVLTASALMASACGGGDASTSESASTTASTEESQSSDVKTVSFFGVTPVTEGNWEPAQYAAFTKMAEKYGFEPSNVENVAYDAAVPVLKRLARSNDVVIAGSSGYEGAVHEVAPQFPDTRFIVFSGLASTEGQDNVSGWAINWNEYGYLAATAACQAAKSRGADTIGHVNSEPIPAFNRFRAGAKQAVDDQGCKILTRWTSSFSDLAKAKQSALSMIADGAEVILSTADTADEGSMAGAAEAGKLYVANYSEPPDASTDDTTLTTIFINFEGAYDEIGQLLASGEIESKAYDVSIATDGLSFGPFMNVDPEVEKKAAEVLDKIKSGEIEIDPQAEIKR